MRGRAHGFGLNRTPASCDNEERYPLLAHSLHVRTRRMHFEPSPSRLSSSRTAIDRAGGWLAKLALLICCGMSGSLRGAFAEPPVDFRRDVLPILSQNCFTCHGPDEKTRKA